MSLSLAELLAIKSEEDWLRFLKQALARQGWALTDVHTGAVGRTLVQIDSRALADLSLQVPQITASGFVDLAVGGWLDLIAQSQYDLERQQGVAAEGVVTFTTAAGFGPYQLQVPTWIATPNRLLYATTEAVTVPAGGSTTARVRAQAGGARYNVGQAAITQLLTPLPGLSCTNAADWIAIAGADPEPDTRLRLRCKTRWPALGSGATRDFYVSHALNAHASVAKVAVLDLDPRGPGTLDVVLAAEGGAVGDEVVAIVDADLQQKRPLTANLSTYSATPRAVTITGTAFVQAAFLAQAQEQAQTNLQAYQRALGIGDTVFRSALIEVWMTAIPETPAAGVINFQLTAPAADVALADVQVAVFDAQGVDWTAV